MFSLTSGDLNDYLAPSLDCVKPVTEKTKTLSLTDCLACSGCITSAEVLLVELHSSSSLDSIPLNKTKTISISQQSRASLAALWNVSSNQAHSILTLFFNSIGIFHVYDVNFARDLSLYHLYQEFKSSNIRPMISGSCPGWICYIEKTHPNLIKNLSTVKSPQQIMASLMKHHLTKKLNVSGSDIYHISIMPCYDKKLEASRLDFKKEDYDVDLVLTTNEILTYMNSKNYIIDKSISIEPDSTYTKTNIFNGKRLLVNVDGSSSGGYAYYIFYKFAASIGIDISISEFLNGSERIVTTVKKDYKIYTLDYNGIKFSVAVIFGFKNIQNFIRRFDKCSFDFVEIQACPSGCVNGGGQVKNSIDLKDSIKAIENKYFDTGCDQVGGTFFDEVLDDCKDHEKDLFFTQFHAVERVDDGFSVKW